MHTLIRVGTIVSLTVDAVIQDGEFVPQRYKRAI